MDEEGGGDDLRSRSPSEVLRPRAESGTRSYCALNDRPSYLGHFARVSVNKYLLETRYY